MKAIISHLLGILALAIAASTAHAEVIVSNNTYLRLDERSDYTVFNVATHGLISDLNVSIEFSKCDNPFIGQDGRSCIGTRSPMENEIEFQLIGPDGRIVRLVNPGTFDEGDTSGVGRVTMTFDDEGQALGKRVGAGSFRPVEALSLFDGMDMFGEWKLFLRDTTFKDPLEVFSSQLVFNTSAAPVAAVPEPGSVAVFGAGLLGLACLRRNRRKG